MALPFLAPAPATDLPGGPDDDERRMAVAFDAAEAALARGDCPFGAAVVLGGEAVALCGSTEHSRGSTTGHAEMDALAEAARALGVPLLHGATLYCTHEPRVMCAGALLHAQVDRVVVGTLRADLPLLFRHGQVTCATLVADASRPPASRSGVLADRGLKLFPRLEAVGSSSPAAACDSHDGGRRAPGR